LIIIRALSLATVLAGGFLLACGSSQDDSWDERAESVVLLHGMGRTRASMVVLAWRFEKAGYSAHNFPYNERTANLDELSEGLHRFIRERVRTRTYHLVAHSLGNIIIRNGFKTPYREGLKRIVMLAPPNRPARLARTLEDNPLYQWITGDSGQKLADPSFYETLPVPAVEFGVIAGKRGQSISFEEPNDGVVQVESTKLEGMSDWIVLDRTHTFIMNAEETFEYCRRFLETGSFSKTNSRQ
jgi:hypothetical protein